MSSGAKHVCRKCKKRKQGAPGHCIGGPGTEKPDSQPLAIAMHESDNFRFGYRARQLDPVHIKTNALVSAGRLLCDPLPRQNRAFI